MLPTLDSGGEYVAVAGFDEENDVDVYCPPVHEPALIAFVRQINARTWSPAFGSDQPTANVIVPFATTGSGVSVTVVIDGPLVVTVKVPVMLDEHRFTLSHANA